jgi:ADP-glucose pyrophosphorylase
VLLEGVVVRSGARVVRTVVDEDVEIGADATVGEPDGEIALVGEDVEPAGSVAAGGRHPEVED